MKSLFKGISLIIVVFGFLTFFYGSIKMARTEAPSSFQSIDTGIPRVVMVDQSSHLRKETAQAIVGTSVVIFGVGIVGFVISSRSSDGSNSTNLK